MDSSTPIVTQMVLVKLCASHNKTKRQECCKELVGKWGREAWSWRVDRWRWVRVTRLHYTPYEIIKENIEQNDN